VSTFAAPSRALLGALVDDLQLPPAWRALAARATAALERQILLTQLGRHLLVSTPYGRARLRAWLDQERATPTTPAPAWLLPRWVRERVLYFGDGPMLEAVVAALVRVPAPVRAAALDEVAFLGVGAGSNGWTGSSRLEDREGETRPRIVNLSGGGRHVDDIMRTVLHELAHAWLLPRPLALVTAQGDEALREVARQDGWLAQADAHIARHERLAEALGLVWGAR